MSSDYDHLTLMQKVEVFEQAIDSTSGDDLAKVLWLKSPSSEVGVCVCVFSVYVSMCSKQQKKWYIHTVSLSIPSPPPIHIHSLSPLSGVV